MKKYFKYAVFFIFLIVSVFFDCCFFDFFRLSLVLCVCNTLYKKDNTAIVISAFCGLLCDLILMSLPYFSLVYLYISLGCVWCKEMLLGINFKKFILINFFAYIVYFLVYHIANSVSYGQIFITARELHKNLASAMIMTSIAPIVYFGFKRLKF